MNEFDLKAVAGQASKGSLTLILDTLESDANFMISHYIYAALNKTARENEKKTANPIESEENVLLIAFAQILNHYVMVLKKMGFNLTASKEKGQFHIIDCLSNLHGWNRQSGSDAPFQLSSSSLKDLYFQIKNVVSKAKSPCIIIDDISILYFSGTPVKDILAFFQYLRCLVEQNGGSLVILAHDDKQELEYDDEYQIFVKSLIYQAGQIIQVRQMDSGYSKDVDGEISLLNGLKLQDASEYTENRSFHFKLSDNSVKLFPKGLSRGLL